MPDNATDTRPHIQVFCPKNWENFVPQVSLLVEASYHCGETHFNLQIPKQITLNIQPSHVIDMEADWSINKITVGLPFRPSLSVWLFSIYFGLAHEIGHLLWHHGPLTLREAWANYFALYVLKTQELLSNRADRVLLVKDFWLSKCILKLQVYSRDPVESAIANIVQVFCKSGNEKVYAFLHVSEETMRSKASMLVPAFSQCFDISETTCREWLREQ